MTMMEHPCLQESALLQFRLMSVFMFCMCAVGSYEVISLDQRRLVPFLKPDKQEQAALNLLDLEAITGTGTDLVKV